MKIQSPNNRPLSNSDSVFSSKTTETNRSSFGRTLEKNSVKDSFVKEFSPTEYIQIEIDIPILSNK